MVNVSRYVKKKKTPADVCYVFLLRFHSGGSVHRRVTRRLEVLEVFQCAERHRGRRRSSRRVFALEPVDFNALIWSALTEVHKQDTVVAGEVPAETEANRVVCGCKNAKRRMSASLFLGERGRFGKSPWEPR